MTLPATSSSRCLCAFICTEARQGSKGTIYMEKGGACPRSNSTMHSTDAMIGLLITYAISTCLLTTCVFTRFLAVLTKLQTWDHRVFMATCMITVNCIIGSRVMCGMNLTLHDSSSHSRPIWSTNPFTSSGADVCFLPLRSLFIK